MEQEGDREEGEDEVETGRPEETKRTGGERRRCVDVEDEARVREEHQVQEEDLAGTEHKVQEEHEARAQADAHEV